MIINEAIITAARIITAIRPEAERALNVSLQIEVSETMPKPPMNVMKIARTNGINSITNKGIVVITNIASLHASIIPSISSLNVFEKI